MKYFIDFEATQFAGEIISVGCVREDGEIFSSLVQPKKSKVNDFITRLTGITQEDIENAPSAEVVFGEMFTWFGQDDNAEVYVWGDSDLDFAMRTCRRCHSYTAKLALGFIVGNLKDYSAKFGKQFGLDKPISLLKVVKCFTPGREQRHDALDDAQMLKFVYEQVNTLPYEKVAEALEAYDGIRIQRVRPEKKKKATKEKPAVNSQGQMQWNKADLPNGTICVVTNNGYIRDTFASYEEAVAWIRVKFPSCVMRDDTLIKGIQNSMKSKKLKGSYHGGIWRLVQKEEVEA